MGNCKFCRPSVIYSVGHTRSGERGAIIRAVAAGIRNWSCCWNHLGISLSLSLSLSLCLCLRRPWRRSICARFASFCDRIACLSRLAHGVRKWRRGARSSIFIIRSALLNVECVPRVCTTRPSRSQCISFALCCAAEEAESHFSLCFRNASKTPPPPDFFY